MAKAIDLVGQRFGKLVVVERAENNHRGNTMWKCQCDCGNTKIALGYDLTHGRTVSCGCKLSGIPAHNRQDLTGQKFNRLTVLNINLDKSQKGRVYWDCLCDCGNTVTVHTNNIKTGAVKSCGCLGNETRKEKLIAYRTGMRYGSLVVIDQIPGNDGKTLWQCKCDCGREIVLNNQQLKKRKSCGCKNGNNINNPNSDYFYFVQEKGIDVKTYYRLRREWSSMITRCKESYHDSHVYFDRSIKVCDEWSRFKNFALWALDNGYSNDLTLDRVNNDLGYSPDNCRWASWKVQQNNKRNNVLITYQGQTRTLKQWSEHLHMSYGLLKNRYQCGWKPPRLFEEKHINQYQ